MSGSYFPPNPFGNMPPQQQQPYDQQQPHSSPPQSYQQPQPSVPGEQPCPPPAAHCFRNGVHQPEYDATVTREGSISEITKRHCVVANGLVLREPPIIDRSLGAGKADHYPNAVLDEIIRAGLILESERVHVQWTFTMSVTMVAICFDSTFLARTIIERSAGISTRAGELHVMEFKSKPDRHGPSAGRGPHSSSQSSFQQQQPYSRMQQSSRSPPRSSSSAYPPRRDRSRSRERQPSASSDVQLFCHDRFFGRLFLPPNGNTQAASFELTTPMMNHNHEALLQRLVWFHPPNPADLDMRTPQNDEPYLRGVLDELVRFGVHTDIRYLAVERDHPNSSPAGFVIMIQLQPHGVVRKWLSIHNIRGQLEEMATFNEFQLNQLEDIYPEFSQLCRRRFHCVPKHGKIEGCSLPNCSKSHDLGQFYRLLDQLAQDSDAIARSGLSRSGGGGGGYQPAPPQLPSRELYRDGPANLTGGGGLGRDVPLALAGRPERGAPDILAAPEVEFEAFDRSHGVLRAPTTRSASVDDFVFDPTFQPATRDFESIIHRLVLFNQPLPPFELTTDEGRAQDLKQVWSNSLQNKISPDQLQWIARLLNDDGQPSENILIQLKLDTTVKRVLGACNVKRDRSVVPYIEYFVAANTRPGAPTNPCPHHFCYLRSAPPACVLERRCTFGPKCRASHLPQHLTELFERVRQKSMGSGANTAIGGYDQAMKFEEPPQQLQPFNPDAQTTYSPTHA